MLTLYIYDLSNVFIYIEIESKDTQKRPVIHLVPSQLLADQSKHHLHNEDVSYFILAKYCKMTKR